MPATPLEGLRQPLAWLRAPLEAAPCSCRILDGLRFDVCQCKCSSSAARRLKIGARDAFGYSSADFLTLWLHSACATGKAARSGDRTGWRRQSRERSSTSVDVFGKGTPAGAFNEAQRLIERPRYVLSFDFLQGRQGRRFGSARQAPAAPRSRASRRSADVQPRLYRLTGLH